MGFFIKKFVAPEPAKPEPGRRKADRSDYPEPVVHKPSCRDEAYLTLKGAIAWDREHIALWEADF